MLHNKHSIITMQKKSVLKSGSETSRGPWKCWEDKDAVMAMNVV